MLVEGTAGERWGLGFQAPFSGLCRTQGVIATALTGSSDDLGRKWLEGTSGVKYASRMDSSQQGEAATAGVTGGLSVHGAAPQTASAAADNVALDAALGVAHAGVSSLGANPLEAVQASEGEVATAPSSALARVAEAKPAEADVAQLDATPTDASLMLRYREGDARAFEILYQRHKGPLYRYLMRMCRHQETANDLFQEVWGKVIASRERYEARAQFNTFLFRIAHNCAVDHFRRAGRQQAGQMQDVNELEDELPGAQAERPDAQLAQTQVRDAFLAALQQLPAEQRNVFVLYEESGLSLEEIGKLTGVAMETAKSRLRYAVNKLRTALRQHRPGQIEQGVES